MASTRVRSEFPVPCIFGLPRCPTQPEHFPDPSNCPDRRQQPLFVLGNGTQSPCPSHPAPHNPSSLPTTHSPFFTLTSNSLNQVALSHPVSPSWDSWRSPDSTAKQSTVGSVSPQSAGSRDLARSRQHRGAGMLPPPLPRGRGCWVNNKLRRKEGGTEGDREERGRKGRGGESTRVRASKETEQWSDSWGYICDDSDSSTHKGKRAHRRTHTRGARGRGGQRSPLKCSHFSGKKKGLWIHCSQLQGGGTRFYQAPPSSFPVLLQALPAPGRARPQPLSPLYLSLWGKRGRSQPAEKPPLGSWVSLLVRDSGEVSPILPVEKKKLNPSLSQRGIYFRAIGEAHGGPSACWPSKGAPSLTEPESHSYAEMTEPQGPQTQAI